VCSYRILHRSIKIFSIFFFTDHYFIIGLNQSMSNGYLTTLKASNMKLVIQQLLRNVLVMITICGAGAMITACDDDDGGGNGSPEESSTFSLTTTGDLAYEAKDKKRAAFISIDSTSDSPENYNPEKDNGIAILLELDNQEAPIDSVSLLIYQEDDQLQTRSYDIITPLELTNNEFQTGSFVIMNTTDTTATPYLSNSGSIELSAVSSNSVKGTMNDITLEQLVSGGGEVKLNGEFTAVRDPDLAE
jgi:hypothetical protein